MELFDVQIVAWLTTRPDAPRSMWRVAVDGVEAANAYEAVMTVIRDKWDATAEYFMDDGGMYFAPRELWPRLELADGRVLKDCAKRSRLSIASYEVAHV